MKKAILIGVKHSGPKPLLHPAPYSHVLIQHPGAFCLATELGGHDESPYGCGTWYGANWLAFFDN